MNTPAVVTGRAPSELSPMPIEPGWILEGSPVARGRILAQSADRLVSSGFWSCTPGKFRWVFSWDEFVQLLEGHVVIREEGGAVHELRPGDVAHFPRGLSTEWHVVTPVRKFFVLRTPEPLRL